MSTNVQFIKELSATSVTNFDMTDCFDNNYSLHKIIVPKYKFAQTTNLYLRFFDSSGSIIDQSEYACADLQMYAGSTNYTEHKTTSTTSIRYIASMGTGEAYGGGIEINVFNAKDSTFTFVTWQASNYYTSQQLGYKGVGVHKNAEVIKGFRLTTINYDLDHISASVYGVL